MSENRTATSEADRGAQAELFLTKQWEQAWQQYRQNETTRSQSLGLYFAFLGVVVAGALNILNGSKPDAPMLLAALAVLGLILLLVTLFVLTLVIKLGAVNWHYVRRIDELTSRLSQGYGLCDEELALAFSPGSSPNDLVNGKIVRIQVLAERALSCLAMIFLALEGLCLSVLWDWWPIPYESLAATERFRVVPIVVGIAFIAAISWWIKIRGPAGPAYAQIRGKNSDK